MPQPCFRRESAAECGAPSQIRIGFARKNDFMERGTSGTAIFRGIKKAGAFAPAFLNIGIGVF
jgi:hypothetical protein